MLTAGGMTSRSLSLGWSWWTPWMMKCMRWPNSLSGSQWKTRRCSQYSVRVQIPIPPRVSRSSLPAPSPRSAAEPLHRDHDRHEDERGDGRVNPREEVEKSAVEHLRGGRQALASLMRSHRRNLSAADRRRTGRSQSAGKLQTAVEEESAICGNGPCGRPRGCLHGPGRRAGRHRKESFRSGEERVWQSAGAVRARGRRRPARTATSAATSSAPWSSTAPARPSAPIAPRASCPRASRCC